MTDPDGDYRCDPQRGRELNAVTYQPHILIKNGSPNQVAIPIQESRMAIGRDQAADIVIDDPAVSRKHAEIVRANDGFLLLDLGSMNGSFVNEMEVGRTGKILRDGDEIRLGSGHSALVFRESNFSQIASRKLRVTESIILREDQGGNLRIVYRLVHADLPQALEDKFLNHVANLSADSADRPLAAVGDPELRLGVFEPRILFGCQKLEALNF